MSTELANLDIEEISGVDAPANGIPGWLVMKSADPKTAVEAQLAGVYAAIGGASALEGAPEDVRKAAEALSTYVEKQLSAPEPEMSLIEKMRSIFKAQQPKPQQADNWGKGGANDDDDADDNVKPPAKAKMKKAKKGAKIAQPNGTDDTQNTQEAQDVQKSLEPVLTELQAIRKQYEDDSATTREALVKALDRIAALETELTGSAQVFGQEYSSVDKAAGPTLHDGIMSAFSGNRVTLH